MTESPPPRGAPGSRAAGLCGICRHVKRNETRRGTVYLRCTRAEWDERLERYPNLPLHACPGFQAASS